MSTTLCAALANYFGFESFRPGQEAVIRSLLEGRSALAVFPTGGGKSLCYQLPALQLDGLTVVVSPLIALMKDQIDFLRKRGISAARLDSTLSGAEVRSVSESIQSGELKLLYVAPERFNNERFIAELKQTHISLFAIDEAHCISEWGHNFRPDYLKLAETVKAIGAERVLALTATATPSVVEDICRSFEIEKGDSIVTGFYRRNLTFLTTPTNAEDRNDLLLARLKERQPGPTIVYVTLQKTAEWIADLLLKNGLPVQAYHAGMAPDLRTEVQDWWMNQPNGIVVATIAFGMGIDKSNVRYVYHYNLPKSLESYSQEIGRAGRDELPSIVELLACPDDVPTLENFAYGDTPSPEAIRSLIQEVCSWSEEVPTPVSPYDLSSRMDMRLLVLRTALTYLELLGFIHGGTPVYTGYDLKPLLPIREISNHFPGVHGEFVQSLFACSKKGRIWYSLNPDDIAEELSVERKRILRAIEVMEQKGLIEVRAADVRTPYLRLRSSLEPETMISDMVSRFEKREQLEIKRLHRVVDLVEHNGCQVNALVGYFGEVRATPCGHCTWCLSKAAQKLPSIGRTEIVVDKAAVKTLVEKCPPELRGSRQVAKILCGLTSPSFTSLKLSRDPLFGSLEQVRFSDVVAWCEAIG